MKAKIKLSSLGMVAYAAIVLALSILSYYKYSINHREFFVISIPLVVIICLWHAKVFNRLYIIFIIMIALTVFRFFFNTWMDASGTISLCLTLWLCVLSYLIFESAQARNDKLEFKLLIIITVGILIYVMISTFKEFSVNPNIARALASLTPEDDEYEEIINGKNIGGFGFSYAIGMFIPYFTSLIVRNKGTKKILPFILWTVAMVYCIYTQYTTLLLLTVIFTAIVVLMQTKNTLVRIVIVVGTLFTLVNIVGIFRFLANNISFATLASHFENMYYSLIGEGEATSRIDAYIRAVKLFFKYPLFGVDMSKPYHEYVVSHSHSNFFSILAGSGAIGTTLYYYIYVKIIKNIKSLIINFKDLIPVYAMFFVLGIVNPVNVFEVHIVIFMLIPLIELYRQRNESGEFNY